MRVSSGVLQSQAYSENMAANYYFGESRDALKKANALLRMEDVVLDEMQKAGFRSEMSAEKVQEIAELVGFAKFSTDLGTHHRRRASKFFRQYNRALRREKREA